MQARKRLILTLFIISSCAISSLAQENRVKVSGLVVDPSGAAIPAAEIQVNLKECKCSDCPDPMACNCCPPQFTAHSRDDGTFSFSIPHGKYHVVVHTESRRAELDLDLNTGDAKNVTITVQ